ncbi:hypothetical protein E3M26_14640 [Salmonella enterica]|uniref:Uncharacterized protein n=2 Tax=Salmonella enterica I TaxID=59201 RepID=A0A4S3EE26_SALAN|nr:hypothetical protein [Salmonella enterica]EAW2168920.1 hypothetical protein [Salmonella enterica subsp. enterica]EBH9993035.1 hypothetical protein [Salmonella enterica subsp. enterica serovar Anatum]ECB3988017.1 hypothetical protein [Salmonella enterica subsp. enterica serovar Eko]ECB6002958.1 hypothetical protein [Salmonella enterica subsp. enterica serovar Hvittingfoss]ECG5307771.1 hypothetical protein [Salmonella enterica subsp. enterica serovar Newington]ECG6086594.1 hypothetical prote
MARAKCGFGLTSGNTVPDGGCALSGLQYLQYQYIAMNFCRPDKRSAIRHYQQANINAVGPISAAPSDITTRQISTL